MVAVAIAITAVMLFKKNNDPTADAEGRVTVELTDLSGRSERHELSFSEGDTLESLLQQHFEVDYDDGQYGAVLMGIGFIKTDFQTTYVSIYVNGEYAVSGVDTTTIEAGATYTFKVEK